jgi:hypothetical protein
MRVKEKKTTMRRRDFVKAMMAASMTAKAALSQQTAAPAAAPPAQQPPAMPPRAPVAPGPVPWMEGLMEARPLPATLLVPDAVAQTNAHFFSDRQMAALRRLSELLMPPMKGHPGATEACAPEFLDFLVGASPADRQQTYQSGLDWLNAEAGKQFGVAFASTSAVQADKLIRPWLRTWIQDHPPMEGIAHFINLAHSDIRTATHNSQAWSDAEIAAGRPAPAPDVFWYPVEPDMRRGSQAQMQRVIPARPNV